MNLEIVHPLAFILLASIPLYLLVVARGRPRGVRRPSAPASRDARRLRVWSAIPGLLRAATLLFLALAIARPRSAGAVVEEEVTGVPIVVAVDISSSMLAEDFQPLNRLEVARQSLERFVGTRERDPIGLVAFAGEALTLTPITMHRAMIRASIESLRIGLLEDGTAIGEGLAVATNRLRDLPGDRVIVLLSDGENNRGVDPREAAQAAAAMGIRVFTVGIGSEGTVPIPVTRLPTGVQYAELAVGIDEPLLREIAAVSGGEYFRATDARALDQVYQSIDRLIASPIQTTRRLEHRELYPFLLLLAALCLCAEWGVRASPRGIVP